MGKYDPLGAFLEKSGAARVPISFAEVEQVLGARLPPKAQGHRAWWSNNPSNNVMTKVWLKAGYITEQVDVSARRLVFRRKVEPVEGAAPSSESSPVNAKARHPLFGAMKGSFRIAPGVDLTEPLWDGDETEA